MTSLRWGKIADVSVVDDETFSDRTFLTIDMDWAHDDVMRDTHALISEIGVPSTWFVTHESPFLRELQADSQVELGIHPNFNSLMESNSINGSTVREVIERLLEIVPDAQSVRAHSLMQSSRILETYASLGLTHDATHYVEPAGNLSLKPWVHYHLVRVPLAWEDYVELYRSGGSPSLFSDASKARPECWQLDFHPIHVYLNTASLSHYEETRYLHHRPIELLQERHRGRGIRTLLGELLGSAGPK